MFLILVLNIFLMLLKFVVWVLVEFLMFVKVWNLFKGIWFMLLLIFCILVKGEVSDFLIWWLIFLYFLKLLVLGLIKVVIFLGFVLGLIKIVLNWVVVGCCNEFKEILKDGNEFMICVEDFFLMLYVVIEM